MRMMSNISLKADDVSPPLDSPASGPKPVLWKKRTIQHPQLGTLSFSRDRWLSESLATPSGVVLVSIDGDVSAPSPAGLATARDILADPEGVVSAAKIFVLSHAEAQEFVGGQGTLVLDGFTFRSDPGSFEVDLALSDWPDAIISVVFRDGFPSDVLLAD
jgi:hypothetical protein